MKKQLIGFYLDWFDNYPTITTFAEAYGLTPEECIRLLEIGRKYQLEESVRQKQIETKLLTD